MSDDDRTRGILTSRDREWLIEQENGVEEGDDVSASANSKRKRKLRERVTSALLDFELLVNELEPPLWRELFEEVNGQTGPLQSDLSDVIAFLYILLNDQQYLADGIAQDESRGAHRLLTFRNTLQNGISTAKAEIPEFDDPPESVIVDTNCRLFEMPTGDNFDPQSQEIMEQWRNYLHLRDRDTGKPLYELGKSNPRKTYSYLTANTFSQVLDISDTRREEAAPLLQFQDDPSFQTPRNKTQTRWKDLDRVVESSADAKRLLGDVSYPPTSPTEKAIANTIYDLAYRLSRRRQTDE